MARLKVAAALVTLTALMGVVCSGAWIRVNAGQPLDNGEGLGGSDPTSYFSAVARTARGDVIYIVNCRTLAGTAGRVRWSDENEWQWEVWTGDAWSSATDAVPASVTDTFGGYSAGLALFADPISLENADKS